MKTSLKTAVRAHTHLIDAKGARLGKVAAEAAGFLMGKDRADFVRNDAPKVAVRIIHAGQTDIPARKAAQKEYVHYSGYPGGRKNIPLRDVAGKKGYQELFRKAIRGMLPKNKLQAIMMNNLIVEE